MQSRVEHHCRLERRCLECGRREPSQCEKTGELTVPRMVRQVEGPEEAPRPPFAEPKWDEAAEAEDVRMAVRGLAGPRQREESLDPRTERRSRDQGPSQLDCQKEELILKSLLVEVCFPKL